MDPRRTPSLQTQKKNVAQAKSLRRSTRGLDAFKNAFLLRPDGDEGRGSAMSLFYGMVQRNPVLMHSSTQSSVDGPLPSVTDAEALKKTEALITQFYEWNSRAFTDLRVSETLQLLYRLGRVGPTHLQLFEEKQRRPFKATALADAANEAQEIALTDHPPPAVVDFDADQVNDPWHDIEESISLPVDELSHTQGIGIFEPPDDEDIFIEN